MSVAQKLIGLQRTTFSPSSVTGLTAWYDFSDATKLFTDTSRTAPVASDADAVAGVTDLSVNGAHLSQAAANNKPAYKAAGGASASGHYLRFDNSVTNRFLDASPGSKSQPNTIFVVAKVSATGGFPCFVASNSGVARNQVYMGNAHWSFYAGTANEAATGPSTGTWYVIETVFNGASSQEWVNGTSVKTGDSGAQAAATIRVGADSSGVSANVVDMEEVLVYNAAVSSGDRSSIRSFLGTKYGITVV